MNVFLLFLSLREHYFSIEYFYQKTCKRCLDSFSLSDTYRKENQPISATGETDKLNRFTSGCMQYREAKCVPVGEETLQQLKKRHNEMEKNLYISKIHHGSTGRSAVSAEKKMALLQSFGNISQRLQKNIDF